MDDAGISHHDAVAGDIPVDKTVGGNHHIITDGDIAHHGVDTNPDPAADGRHALALSPVLLTDDHTLADFRGGGNLQRLLLGMEMIGKAVKLLQKPLLHWAFRSR